MYLLVIALILLSPALLAGSLLFPFFWISQVRLLRRTGSWILHRDAHARWMKRFGRAILASYVIIVGSLAWPDVFPRVRQFLESGWMLGIAIPIAVDAAILMLCSPD
jgi:hypothetical protein